MMSEFQYIHIYNRGGKLLSDYWDCVTINIICKVNLSKVEANFSNLWQISEKLWHQNMEMLVLAHVMLFAALYSYFTALTISSSPKTIYLQEKIRQ